MHGGIKMKNTASLVQDSKFITKASIILLPYNLEYRYITFCFLSMGLQVVSCFPHDKLVFYEYSYTSYEYMCQAFFQSGYPGKEFLTDTSTKEVYYCKQCCDKQ